MLWQGQGFELLGVADALQVLLLAGLLFIEGDTLVVILLLALNAKSIV